VTSHPETEAADILADPVMRPLVDELFGVELGDFVATRNRLAAELRDQGRDRASRAVRGLRKPTVSAWAVNQLSRRHGREMDELLAVSARLGDAQSSSSADASPDELRSMARRRHELVSELARRAGSILADAAVTPARTHLDKITTSLLSAGDEATSELLHAGSLTHDLSPAGFGAAPAEDEQHEGAVGAIERSEVVLRAEHEAARLGREADRAREAAARAQDEAKRAAAEAQRAGAEAERAAAEAERAGATAARAEAEAERVRGRAGDR
jgi:hypothetical protein